MSKSLPGRPNLDHLKKQAKALLADLKAGDSPASKQFIQHLPAAKKLTRAKVRAAGFKLADAQSVVARSFGFESWAALARHVEHINQLEGEWRFVGLRVDGTDMPAAMTAGSRLMMDGDRFRMESAEANFDGVFTIDASSEPMRIDIDFVEGPEAGNRAEGIFKIDGDQLTICLGVVGASRPKGFTSKPGSGHALERWRRAKVGRQSGVTGGTAPAPSSEAAMAAAPADASRFDNVEMTPMMRRLEGEWAATALTRDGIEMNKDWLPFGSRAATGNEVKVVFGGQVMVHAKVRLLDEAARPTFVDYLNLAGGQKGKISLGIMEWLGEEVRFLMAAPGQPRPSGFDVKPARGLTFSQWRRK